MSEAEKEMPIMGKCIAFANHKGGSGKTTACLSIAGCLAKSGCRVLVVDFAPQANATSGLGIEAISLQHSIYDAVLEQCDGYKGAPITRVILETAVENLHIAPSELDLAVAEVLMRRSQHGANVLGRILEGIRPFYDYILVDLPPSSGLLTINGLCASDEVITPVEPSLFSLEALNALITSFDDIERITGRPINQTIAILTRYAKHSLFSRVFRGRNPSQEIEVRLRDMVHKLFIIPNSIEICQSQNVGVPISHYAPDSKVGKAYAEIARSILVATA